MRFRLPRFTRRVTAVAIVSFVGIAAIGGGVYAAIGGAGQSQNLSTLPINLDQNLIGRWKLDGNAKDSTPYADNGVVSGATLTTDRKAKANSAYSFNGSSNYITIPSSSTLNQTTSTSISVWAKLNATGGQQVLFSKGSDCGGTGWGMILVANGSNFIAQVVTGGAQASAQQPTALSTGVWYNVTGVYNSVAQTITLFVNGQQVATHSATGTLRAANNSYIGGFCSGGSPTLFTNGSLDDARLWNRSLNSSEVQAVYDSYDTSIKADAGTSGLIGQYKFDGNAKDSSPYGNNATVVSGAVPIADREGRVSSAYSFNGTSSYIGITHDIPRSDTTMSFWMKTSTADQGIMTYSATSYKYAVYTDRSFFVNPDGTLRAYVYVGSVTPNNFLNSSTVVNDGKWHQITLTFNTSGKQLYIDGVLAASNSTGIGAASSMPYLTVGWANVNTVNTPTNLFYNGSLDDVRIYNRMLSPTEVKSLAGSYNAVIQVSNLEAGEVADYPFNGNAKDNTSYGNNGTVNGATLTTDREGRSNSAYSFDGNSNYIGLPSNATDFSKGFTISVWANPLLADRIHDLSSWPAELTLMTI